MIRVSSFQTFAEVCYSVFAKRSSFKSMLNLRKAYILTSLLKVNYRSVFNESSKAFIFLASHANVLRGSSAMIAWGTRKNVCVGGYPLSKVCTLSIILLWIKPSYFSLENECDSWCMHQTRLCGSASVMPQSKSTELCSSAAVIPQIKSTEMWSLEAPFHHDLWMLWYFQHWTNEHFRSMLFIRKNVTSPK